MEIAGLAAIADADRRAFEGDVAGLADADEFARRDDAPDAQDHRYGSVQIGRKHLPDALRGAGVRPFQSASRFATGVGEDSGMTWRGRLTVERPAYRASSSSFTFSDAFPS